VQNLVDEILQSAVGNHFRDKLQSLPAVGFIQTRQEVQEGAFIHIKGKLEDFEVETIGVYIQDVVLPAQLVTVLTQREIANQEIETYKKQEEAQIERVKMENATGIADQQKELARAKVGVEVKLNDAQARKHQANGEATYISETGKAKAAEVLAVGIAKAEGYRMQVMALGREPTAMVNVIGQLAEKGLKFVPDVTVGSGGSSLDALAAVLTRNLVGGDGGSVDPSLWKVPVEKAKGADDGEASEVTEETPVEEPSEDTDE